jgi:16S rRNA (guanine(527)-N(7))-methyltransferase RsmG
MGELLFPEKRHDCNGLEYPHKVKGRTTRKRRITSKITKIINRNRKGPLPVSPSQKSLGLILARCGIALDSERLERLWRYHQMLRAANAELNLTRIHNFENMVLKHYVDSLLVLGMTDLPSPLIDMGSGAGLPGIPLKIARPDVQIVLAEPRGARAAFLGDVCRTLGLEGIDVHAHKLGADYPGRVRGVISRAVGSIPDTLDRVATCLEPGGRMLFMKGPDCDLELAEAQSSHSSLFRLMADHSYMIPGTTHARRLIEYERLVGEAPPARARSAVAAATFEGSTREITSDANASFQRCRDLLSGPGIRKHGEAIVAGSRICAEIVARFSEHVLGWLTDTKGAPPPSASIPWYRFNDPLFKQLDVVGTHAPLLLVKVPQFEPWSDHVPWPVGCTLFVPFQDPENVGSVIRSAAAFGVARVVLLREAAHPFHPRASRAAGPALLQVPILTGPALDALRLATVPLIALDTTGTELGDAPFPDRFGLVVGVEGPGLPESLRHGERRRIAIEPGVESLNAATAAAIGLYAWARQR